VFDRGSTNPFMDPPPHRVVVKATQGNWVNFRREIYCNGHQNESMTRREFAFCYFHVR